MAGLTANIITSKNRAMPDWPRAYSPYYYYGVTGNQENSSGRFFPGFANDSLACSALKMILHNSGTDNIEYYNGQGVQVTTGDWASGYAVNEQWSDGDLWTAHYMDSVDNKLYSLVTDTGTDPDTVRLVSIDKDGNTADESDAFQVTNTALNGENITWNSTPLLYRVGGVDGTGNFRFDLFDANTDNDNGTAPHDGVRLEFNLSTNAVTETTDGILPNNLYGRMNLFYNIMGPTSNNIMGGVSEINSTTRQMKHYGNLVNMTDGRMANTVKFGNVSPLASQTAGAYYKCMPWLGGYHFHGVSSIQLQGALWYEREAMDNFIDELAVYYGVL